MTHPLKVIVAGRQPVSVDGIRKVIEADGFAEVTAVTVGDAAELARKVIGHRPDATVLDMFDPEDRGPIAEAADEIRDRGVEPCIVILTHMKDPALARDMIRACQCSYVLKGDDSGELAAAVQEAAAGRTYLSPQISMALARAAMAAEEEVLTARELEVLRLTALGFTNHEMAERMFLSVRTVESYRASILEKLGITRRYEMVQEAMLRHLIETEMRTEQPAGQRFSASAVTMAS